MASTHPTHLNPSQLGTKEYWDKTYTHDLANHASNPSDIGTVWFSDSAAEDKVLEYLTSASASASASNDDEEPRLDLDMRKTSFLDLGTGNGSMLFLLREEGGFEGRMVGVDYSRGSVELARRIAEGKGMAGGGVVFEEWDVMREEPGRGWMGEEEGEGEGGFDVVLDKGTFDAVSLSEEVDEEGRRVCEGYRERVERLVKRGGYVLVTSCNWTEEELEGWFGGGELEVFGRIKYPRFSFGGKTGQSISSVCFRRKL